MKTQITEAQKILSRKKSDPQKAIRILKPFAKMAHAPWPVFHFLGVAQLKKHRYQQATYYFKQAIERGADEAETYHLLSVSQYNDGKLDEAIDYAEKALQRKEDFFEAWLNLGSVFRAKAKLNEALKCYQKANKLDPRSAGVAFRIGAIYNDQGDMNKALELYDIALQIDPDYHEAYQAKAKIHENKRQFEEAERCLDAILDKDAHNVPAIVSKAELYKLQGKYDKAIVFYEDLLSKYPSHAAIRINYALCLQDLGRFDESERHYKRAMHDNPESFEALTNYLMGVHYNPKRTKKEIFEAHLLWDQQYAPEETVQRPVPLNTDVHKKLRLGFISGGFRRHPVGWMIIDALEHLPKDQFEIYCYTTNNIYDKLTQRIHGASDQWRSVIGYKDEIIADMIRGDEIDVLVELSGHSADTRLKTVAMEPAPVIVKWVGGLFNTSGLKAIDYLLSDWHETPEGDDPYYTEKLVRLPDDYISYSPPEYAPAVGPLPVNEKGYVTFGCFNNPTKVNADLLTQWADIMKRVPESRLFLKSKQYGAKAFTDRISRQMEELGIAPERLIFEAESPHNELLEAYNRVDIALDPWPYSGGLTTCEALWMGVPVITLPGPTFAGKHSTTHLHNAGLSEMIAPDWQEYKDKAMALASDREKLAQLRAGLREKVAQSLLCDGERFAAHLAMAFREMWKQRVQGYKENNENWQSAIEIAPLKIAGIKKGTRVKTELFAKKRKMHTNGQTSIDKKRNQERPSEVKIKPVDLQVPVSGADKDIHSSQEDYQIQLENGITVSTPADLKLLTPYVLLEQERWIEPEVNFAERVVQPGMNVLDIGAGFGVYALPMARKVGKEGRVYAFEPTQNTVAYLEQSKSKNDFVQLEIFERALWNETGKGYLVIADTPEFNKLDEQGTKEVSLTTLDAWWEFEGQPEIDFLKIDVNGTEEQVIRGGLRFLEEISPFILLSRNTDRKQGSGETDVLKKLGYQFYEYVAGPGVLIPHDASGADSYLTNIFAVKPNHLEKLDEAGWLFREEAEPEEVEDGRWKSYMKTLPWTQSLIEEWERQEQRSIYQNYFRALDYLCAAEMMNELQNSLSTHWRSEKAALLLKAAQLLMALYNKGDDHHFTTGLSLARVLDQLGKRSQAVDILGSLLDSNGTSRDHIDALPFLPPLTIQDKTAIRTDFGKWLMVRMVEAWILLKEASTYFSGERERKMLKALKGNPEAIELVNNISSLLFSTAHRSNSHVPAQSKNKFIHLCFNHVYAKTLSDLLEYVNKNSEQEHHLYIEHRRAIADYHADIGGNKHSSFFNCQTQLQEVYDECMRDDVEGIFVHGIFFDWQKSIIKQVGNHKHIAWKLWGGDLYNPIKAGQPFYDVMKYVNSVHAKVEGDLEIIERIYGKKQFFRFGYVFPGLYGTLPETIEKSTPPLIIVGNSGDPSNNHIEILEILSEKEDIQDYQLLFPVAYNLSPRYRTILINTIEKLGLKNISKLHETFIHPDDYIRLMMEANIFITAHNRQQGIGSILSSIYSGNNTFVRKKIILNDKELTNPTWRFLEDHNLEVQPFEELFNFKKLSDIERIGQKVVKGQQQIIKEKIGLKARGNDLISICNKMVKEKD